MGGQQHGHGSYPPLTVFAYRLKKQDKRELYSITTRRLHHHLIVGLGSRHPVTPCSRQCLTNSVDSPTVASEISTIVNTDYLSQRRAPTLPVLFTQHLGVAVPNGGVCSEPRA